MHDTTDASEVLGPRQGPDGPTDGEEPRETNAKKDLSNAYSTRKRRHEGETVGTRPDDVGASAKEQERWCPVPERSGVCHTLLSLTGKCLVIQPPTVTTACTLDHE